MYTELTHYRSRKMKKGELDYEFVSCDRDDVEGQKMARQVWKEAREKIHHRLANLSGSRKWNLRTSKRRCKCLGIRKNRGQGENIAIREGKNRSGGPRLAFVEGGICRKD